MTKDVDQALRDAVQILDKLNLPYAIMGGLAVRAHSIPRATRDVDITIAASPSDIRQLAEAFEELGYTFPPVYDSGWTDRVAEMPLVKFRWHMPGGELDIDMFVADSPFQHAYMARRQLARTGDLDAWIVSPEDLILLKVVAGRPRDLVDVADVLFMQGQLDEAYMRTWAKRLGVLDALERALATHPGDERP